MMAAEIESCPHPAHRVEMRPFVIAPRVADLVGLQCGVVQPGFGDKSHGVFTWSVVDGAGGVLVNMTGTTMDVFWPCSREWQRMMKRAVIGVPS
jgi:hypothetical protein